MISTDNKIAQIRLTIEEIINDFLENEIDYELEDDDEPLRIILSDSIQAINFITLLENEFEIEFDDDEIDLEFFTSVELITDLIVKHVEKKTV